MSEEIRDPETEEEMLTVTQGRLSALLTFATAVSRSHPDPAALAAALERTIAEDSEGMTPVTELTPAMELGRQYEDGYLQSFLRIAQDRARAAGKSAG